jgi:hypothetical protein
VTFLLISKTGSIRRTRWATAAHYRAADRRELTLVAVETQLQYRAGRWRPIPARRGEPLVMLLDAFDDDDAAWDA